MVNLLQLSKIDEKQDERKFKQPKLQLEDIDECHDGYNTGHNTGYNTGHHSGHNTGKFTTNTPKGKPSTSHSVRRNQRESGIGGKNGAHQRDLEFKGEKYKFGGPHSKGFYYICKPDQFKSSAQIAIDRAKADDDYFEQSSKTSGNSGLQSTRRLNPYKTQSAFLAEEERKKHTIMIKPWTEES